MTKNSGSFKPNVSGNPGGRFKDPAAIKVRALARSYSESAIQKLHSIMNNPETDDRNVIACANSILDRGIGKPKQDGGALAELLEFISGLGDGALSSVVQAHLETKKQQGLLQAKSKTVAAKKSKKKT